jgi:sugar phosphate isomerase/epimerase
VRLGIITDEISQDLDHALDVCADLDVRTVELRAVDDQNIVAHTDERIAAIKARLDARGFDVCGIASPFLKVHLHGDGPAQGNTHSAAEVSREDQWAVLDRSFAVARLFGAPLVRAFSFWRVPDPTAVRDEVLGVLAEAARRTEAAGLTLGIENEHACNVATGAETGWMLERIPSPAFAVIWDPGNEAALGSAPFPGGYAHVRGRIAHVHLKDLDARGRWGKMGTGVVDYLGQLRALAADGYDGVLSLETHYATPDGGREGASRESLAAIRTLCERAGVPLTG